MHIVVLHTQQDYACRTTACTVPAFTGSPRSCMYRDEIAKKLDISRVVFLFVVVIDFVGLALAMIMRGMSDHPYR